MDAPLVYYAISQVEDHKRYRIRSYIVHEELQTRCTGRFPVLVSS